MYVQCISKQYSPQAKAKVHWEGGIGFTPSNLHNKNFHLILIYKTQERHGKCYWTDESGIRPFLISIKSLKQ